MEHVPAQSQKDSAAGSAAKPPPAQLSEPELVNLPPGTELSVEEASATARTELTRLIIIAGAPASGKTTLLTSIYEKFQEGPFAGYLFAGSRTLPGFEQRCHMSRTSSGRESADTARTKAEPDIRYLHLRVLGQDGQRAAKALLLSDLSGEVFRLAKDSIDECQRLVELLRADRIVCLIDGDRLVQLKERHVAVDDGLSLLRSFLDSGMLGRTSLVDVVFSKYDTIVAQPTQTEIQRFVQQAQAEFRRRFEARVGLLRFASIAARPQRGSTLPYAHGVADLLPDWMEQSPFNRSLKPFPELEQASGREFDRFLWRASAETSIGRQSV